MRPPLRRAIPASSRAARRRMGRHRAQLHLGHHRQSEGRRRPTIAAPISTPSATSWPAISASIRSISGRCRCSTATAGAFPGPWRPPPALNVCLRKVDPAQDLRADRRARRHPHVRRADRLQHADQCAGCTEGSARRVRRRTDRRRRAAGRRARRRREHRHQADACLRPDRGLWPRLGLRRAAGLGRTARRPARRSSSGGRACPTRCRKPSRCSIPRPCARCRATARPSARSCSAAIS